MKIYHAISVDKNKLKFKKILCNKKSLVEYNIFWKCDNEESLRHGFLTFLGGLPQSYKFERGHKMMNCNSHKFIADKNITFINFEGKDDIKVDVENSFICVY